MRRPGLPGLTIPTIINRLWKPEAIQSVSTRFPISRSLFVDPAMTFETHLETFAGLPVIDFRENTDWQGPAHCYRVHLQYEDPESVETILDRLLAQAGDTGLKALIIGAWNGALEGDDSAGLVSSLVSRVGHLAGLKALFLGEMTFDEYEISWINQSDVSPVLRALPNLEEFYVRGGTRLTFSQVEHPHLRTLVIQAGGLSRDLLRELFACRFPALQHLDLLLGTEDYGFNGEVEDLLPLLQGTLFPRLKHLGLMNSIITDDIAALVVNSPIIRDLESLDLSLGTLTDEGAGALLSLPTDAHLKRLDISHHYLTPEALARLQRLPFELVADDPQDPNDEWRGPVHAE
jgi:hypothetical protein